MQRLVKPIIHLWYICISCRDDIYLHVITFKHCCDFTSKCKMGDIIDMQNIRATCVNVANMDEILIPIDVET
jgi:hypothetical protein